MQNYFFLGLFLLFSVAACTKHSAQELEMKHAESTIEEMEGQLTKLQDQAKVNGSRDPGKQAQSARDADLMKSRLERLKEHYHYNKAH